MALITRGGKGSPLTIEELDGNFTYLESISGGSGATPSLQDVTDAGAVTTNEIIIGDPSGLYSLVNDRSLLINYSDGITQSNTSNGYFSVFNEWDGDNWFEVYYTTYNGTASMSYDIYGFDDQINLVTYNSSTLKQRGLRINGDGFIFQGNGGVTFNIDDLSSNYTIKLPNKSAGTYTSVVSQTGITYTANTVHTLTQAEYDAIGTKDPNTIYFII